MMKKLSNELELKINKLKEWFDPNGGSIVAFSGGIDSSLVLYIARIVQGKDKVLGVISNSESLKNKDFELAKTFCNKYDINLKEIYTNELKDAQYNVNPSDRCFFCKEHLYKDLGKVQEEYPGYKVLNGTNLDDYSDYRPGLRAAADYKIYSPIADCKITKEELREIARYYDLMNWDKPASPCLSSRIPYGSMITKEKLFQIEKAEDILNSYGFEDVRVRHYEGIARVEVKAEVLGELMKVKENVFTEIIDLGFKRCEIDEEGLVSGKLNRVLKN